MNYESVYLEEKTVAGLKIRTSNNDPEMTQDIGLLWQKFFNEGIYQSISGKVNAKTLGLYTNYENELNGKYDMIVGCEIKSNEELPENITLVKIPSGKYARFIVKGDMQKAVGEFWMKLWSLELDRKFSCDFEEYQPGSDMNNAEIHIYIALN